MITFLLCIAVLILGYLVYGRVVERAFKPDDRETPAIALADGVDYVALPTWRVFLIQLLNIAGTGPIFGALMGAVFGPVVFIWIVLGSIFGGAVHDYLVGMMSERMKGATIAEIVGKYMGKTALFVMRIFSVVLLILVGSVFTSSPAQLMARLTPDWMNTMFWLIVIMIYYILATLMPIDQIISKIYPFFGAVLIIMAVGIPIALVATGRSLPELSLVNQHPDGLPAWPFMCITVACGAISGFHATQSPLMARCIKSEREGRKIFYGAMIGESIIAMVWAAAGVAFYGTTGGLQSALANLGQSGAVYEISTTLMGAVGGVLAVIGVVACPITSGDTAFRSARLALADWFKIDQKPFVSRLLVAIPCLAAGFALTFVNFNVIWRYFSWSNQTLAMIALWSASMYLLKNNANWKTSLIAAIPASYMTAVSAVYFFAAGELMNLPYGVALAIGLPCAVVAVVAYGLKVKKVIGKTV